MTPTEFCLTLIARHVASRTPLGEQWQSLAELWRAKQLQYTWLRSLAGHYSDFWQVTADLFDFAFSTLQLEDSMLHARLMNLYLVLSAYPEVPATLKRLNAAGMKLAILSNGTPAMLGAAIANCGISSPIRRRAFG